MVVAREDLWKSFSRGMGMGQTRRPFAQIWRQKVSRWLLAKQQILQEGELKVQQGTQSRKQWAPRALGKVPEYWERFYRNWC